MSSLAPAAPPELDGGAEPPPLPPQSPPAPSPEAPFIQVPLPSLPPVGISINPSPLAAPPLSTPPIPTPSPVTSPPLPPLQPPSLPLPQPQPQPPLTSTPPPTAEIPPQKTPNPPSVPSPVDKPINTSPTPPSTKASPPTPASPSPRLEQPPQSPPRKFFRRPKTKPSTQPNPSHLGTSKNTPASASASPPSSLPASAVLPSAPPVALPVPQAPGAGVWMPFSSETPSPLPSLPAVKSPAVPLFGTHNGADHQHIEAAAGTSGRSTGSSAVVGLCVGGVLLVLLGAILAILVVICRRRGKKYGEDGSGSKHAAAFCGFDEKTSLPQYLKLGPNAPVHQIMVNVPTPPILSNTTNGFSHGGGHIMGTPNPIPAVSSGAFTYEELARATNGFSEGNLLGQGGFGYVHKGVLQNGKEVAVKQLKMGGHQGEREFRAEVETISQVHHKHLVSLVGYCIAGAERLLVYEFVPNNTLDFHLHGKGEPVMDWPTRLKIAIGSAKGFAYLHEDCSPTIIHRDIKAANILLDFNFEAKVSDFGLAKIFTNTNSSVTHITTRVVGTFGYLAPEYASSGKVTDKSDVYSYGVMLLELITGRPPISNFESATNGSLVNWARPLLTQAIGEGNFDNLADPQLQNSYNVEEMASMVSCAAACVRISACRRPRMSQVVRALEGNLLPSKLDDGTRPGDSSTQFPYESLDIDARHYIEDLRRMALTSGNNYSASRYSENTSSEYGLYPSASSTTTSQ